MNLRLERGELSLPNDFKFDIQSNHPFFSSEGTASVPVTVPPSAQNRMLLCNPDNQHSAKRFVKQLPATLSHGIYTKRCQIIIDAASRQGGISCSLALQESELYAQLQDKKLPDVFAEDTVINTFSSGISASMSAFAQTLSKDYVCFPVAADAEDAEAADATGSKKLVKTIINELNGSSLKYLSGRDITINDETVSVPSLYGIALFMPLRTLLRKMFEKNFYTVVENVFETDPVLKDIVIVHNTIDALVNCATSNMSGGMRLRVHEKYMVPSLTIGEMLEWIRLKFGAFVTVNGKRISIRLFRDTLQLSPDCDLSAYVEDEVSLQHPTCKMLRYSCQHEIEGDKPAADTLEDLRVRYSSIVDCRSIDQIVGTGLFYVAPLGKYYYRQTQNSELTTSMVGTDSFDYYRKKDIDTESYESDDQFVPMVMINGEYMPYIGDSIRRYIDTSDKETDAEQPLMILYARNTGSRNFGSPYNYRPDGSDLPAGSENLPNLTPEQLAPHFFGEWRDLLLNAAPIVTCKLCIPMSQLVAMDPWTPKLLNHSKILIKSLKYSISNTGTSSCEAELQLLSEFTDAEQISNPDPFSSNLGWRVKNNRSVFDTGTVGKFENYVRIEGTDGLPDYTMGDAPEYTPDYPGSIVKKRQRWVRVHRHTAYYKWFLDNGYSDYYYTHYYEEYFESYNQE